MQFGYNTNGFAHHRLDDALTILAELGYGSVALTLDHHVLNPYDADTPRRLPLIRDQLHELGFGVVVETGARFLLDPRRKHQPTLLDADAEQRGRRLDFLRRSVGTAVALGGDVVSFWSGAAPQGAADTELMDRLVDNCRHLSDYAAAHGVRLAFEPEPGMFIDRMERWAELHERVAHPNFGLTIDVGHLYCLGETPIAPHLRRWRQWLWNVHIEDMRRGVHDHLMFGEGDIDFAEVMQAFAEIDYAGGLHVELSRHSHDAVETARRALVFLQGVSGRECRDTPTDIRNPSAADGPPNRPRVECASVRDDR